MEELSKPQHVGQMHEMFGRHMTLVIFVVMWFVPKQWNDNRGIFEDMYAGRFGPRLDVDLWGFVHS